MAVSLEVVISDTIMSCILENLLKIAKEDAQPPLPHHLHRLALRRTSQALPHRHHLPATTKMETPVTHPVAAAVLAARNQVLGVVAVAAVLPPLPEVIPGARVTVAAHPHQAPAVALLTVTMQRENENEETFLHVNGGCK